MTENKNNNFNWVQILTSILMGGLTIFGISMFMKADAEEKRRIEAQNKIAEMSETVQERELVWSRLAQQKDEVFDILQERNGELASIIQERDAEIFTLTETIANFEPVRVVVRRGRVRETRQPENRIRVDFEDENDPIRVSGHTLTNPPEAEVEVGFTRPLRLTTTVTQEEDGSWRSYVSGDWPNLSIEQTETVVNPRPIEHREWVENIIIGGNVGLGVAPEVDSTSADVYLMYSVDDVFAVGPSVGFDFVQDNARLTVGIQAQFYPWRL